MKFIYLTGKYFYIITVNLNHTGTALSLTATTDMFEGGEGLGWKNPHYRHPMIQSRDSEMIHVGVSRTYIFLKQLSGNCGTISIPFAYFAGNVVSGWSGYCKKQTKDFLCNGLSPKLTPYLFRTVYHGNQTGMRISRGKCRCRYSGKLDCTGLKGEKQWME